MAVKRNPERLSALEGAGTVENHRAVSLDANHRSTDLGE
jgi:hypothetical protein